MFALRGMAISSSVFFTFYIAQSAAVSLLWRTVYRSRRTWAGTSADLLFILRMSPFLLAAAVTLILTLPSFLMFESRSVTEAMGGMTILLGFGGLAVLLAGAWNLTIAWIRASRTVARWACGARMIRHSPLNSRQSVSVLLTPASAPPLTAAGIFRPRVWLSGAAECVLTEPELESAVRHEVVHVRRRDNLRKLLLRAVAFPGMEPLEGAWREATELAADDGAVSSVPQALDLAAAVIKLSRLAPVESPAPLTTALVNGPVECINARVERLLAWTEPQPLRSVSPCALGYGLGTAAAVVATLVLTYSELLVRVHVATEWLIR